MNLRSNFALTVAGLGAIASTGVLLFSKESNEAPAPEPQHRELTRHWFKKEVNPNGNKVWRRNKWSWYNGKKKEGRAYNYYYDRPGWTPNPNREINIQRRKARGGGGDRNRALCSCTFRDNDGIEYDAMRPAIFGDDYICGACQGSGAFKMAVMDAGGVQTASKYFPCPSPAGATSADLTRADYEGASVASVSDFYSAPEVDFSGCPEDSVPPRPGASPDVPVDPLSNCNDANPRVAITGEYTNPNGKYFRFETSELRAKIGAGPDHLVCQYRDGEAIWAGAVKVTDTVGRAEPRKDVYDWPVGDEISLQGEGM